MRAGLRAAQDRAGTLSGALFLLADQPGVSTELLSALVQRHRETLAPVVAPRYEGQRGNPVLFDRRTFAEFSTLTGDVGARSIIRRHEDAIAWVDWPGAVAAALPQPADDRRWCSGVRPRSSGIQPIGRCHRPSDQRKCRSTVSVEYGPDRN